MTPPLQEVPREVRFTETEDRAVGARVCGRGQKGSVQWGQSFIWGNEKVLEMNGGDGCTTV